MAKHTDFIILKGEQKRADVQKAVDQFLKENNGTCYDKLVMRKGYCSNEEGAKGYLTQINSTDLECIKYVISAKLEPSEEEVALRVSASEAYDVLHELENTEYLDTIKFDRFRCPHCDCDFPHEVIMREVRKTFGTNKCPICNEDYRPQKIHDKLTELRDDYFKKEWAWRDANRARVNKERSLDTYNTVISIVWYSEDESNVFKP